jgi:hypothetical protein
MSSLLGKYKIAVDTANVADGDSIASYLVDSAGTLLTSTLVGADQSLDVNVTQSVLPTGAATETTLASVLSELQALSHAEDAAHTSGDLGVMSLAVRNDAGTPLAADGDYIPLTTDSSGALRVVGTFSVDFSFDYAEDSAHTTGDVGAFTLAVRRDTRTSGVSADGDYASFNVNANGELYVHDVDALAELVAANASLDAIEASVASIDADTSSIITELQTANTSLDNIEADADAIRVELLDQGTTLDSILADTATIDSNLASLTKAEDAAHSSGDAGIQALAVRKDASGSNAADGDYTSLITNSAGDLKVSDVANASILQQQVSVTNTAAALPATALSGRKSLLIQNVGGSKCWIGSATVTTSGATSGIELPANSFMELEVGAGVAVYAIKNGAGGNSVNILELA